MPQSIDDTVLEICLNNKWDEPHFIGSAIEEAHSFVDRNLELRIRMYREQYIRDADISRFPRINKQETAKVIRERLESLLREHPVEFILLGKNEGGYVTSHTSFDVEDLPDRADSLVTLIHSFSAMD